MKEHWITKTDTCTDDTAVYKKKTADEQFKDNAKINALGKNRNVMSHYTDSCENLEQGIQIQKLDIVSLIIKIYFCLTTTEV